MIKLDSPSQVLALTDFDLAKLHYSDHPITTVGICQPKEDLMVRIFKKIFEDNPYTIKFRSFKTYPYGIGMFGSYKIVCKAGTTELGMIILDKEEFDKYFTLKEEA